MTSALQQLPEGYCEIWRADLQKNKKQALAVNGLALGLGAAMLAPFLYGIFQPLSSGGIHFHVTQFLAMLAGLLAYIPLHELVHGLCMKYFGAKKVRYGYTGLYAWAGSSEYFGRRSYAVIALAPLAFWGAVLASLCPAVPAQWFWVLYLVQVANVSGAAGDLYITWKALHMPAEVLIQDTGTEMAFYAPQAPA